MQLFRMASVLSSVGGVQSPRDDRGSRAMSLGLFILKMWRSRPREVKGLDHGLVLFDSSLRSSAFRCVASLPWGYLSHVSLTTHPSQVDRSLPRETLGPSHSDCRYR